MTKWLLSTSWYLLNPQLQQSFTYCALKDLLLTLLCCLSPERSGQNQEDWMSCLYGLVWKKLFVKTGKENGRKHFLWSRRKGSDSIKDYSYVSVWYKQCKSRRCLEVKQFPKELWDKCWGSPLKNHEGFLQCLTDLGKLVHVFHWKLFKLREL